MPWAEKSTEVSFTGAWSAVMVNEAAPPWATVRVFAVMVRVGTTGEVIVTDVVLGDPIC